MWLFLDLLAAEGLVLLVTNVAPIFVVALAVTAFANGLWMCVGGFMVPLGTLNVFWKYVFHYIDYQAYVFQGMMVRVVRVVVVGSTRHDSFRTSTPQVPSKANDEIFNNQLQVNEFAHRIYTCATVDGSPSSSPQYHCMYPSDLEPLGQIRGTAVLDTYQYSTDRVGEWVGIMIAIIAAYRILGFAVLWVKKH
jgi:hypothetical protein